MKLSERLQKILKDIQRMRRTGILLKTGSDVTLVLELEAAVEESTELEVAAGNVTRWLGDPPPADIARLDTLLTEKENDNPQTD